MSRARSTSTSSNSNLRNKIAVQIKSSAHAKLEVDRGKRISLGICLNRRITGEKRKRKGAGFCWRKVYLLLTDTHSRTTPKRHEIFSQMRSVRRDAQPSVGPKVIGICVDIGIHMNAANGHAGWSLHPGKRFDSGLISCACRGKGWLQFDVTS